MIGIGISLTRIAVAAAGAGGGPPVTITATGTEFLAAASASYRVTAGKLYLQATAGNNFSAFTFLVKGSDASLTMQNDAAYYDGAVVVSVDGGAYSVATNAGAVYTLFAGLADAWHKVSIKTGGIWGANNLHLVPAAAVLSVTGVGAGWLAPTSWLHPGDVNALIHTTGALTDNVTEYIPAKVMAQPYPAVSNVGSIRFRSSATKLFLFAQSDFPLAYIFYSRNGGAPVRVAVPGNGTVVEGFDGTAATYTVWSNSGRYLSVGSDATIVDVGTKKRIDQFGDSITAGDSGSGTGAQTNTRGDVETLGVAANLGFAGATYGISGLTIEGLNTAISTILAALPAASSTDMAVLAIGRNDVGIGFDALRQTYFNAIVAALLAKGYGRVICRAVLPDASSWDAFNTVMQALVTARADPKVVFVPTSTWTGVTTSDGVHPDQDGYLTLRGYAITAYTPHIPT